MGNFFCKSSKDVKVHPESPTAYQSLSRPAPVPPPKRQYTQAILVKRNEPSPENSLALQNYESLGSQNPTPLVKMPRMLDMNCEDRTPKKPGHRATKSEFFVPSTPASSRTINTPMLFTAESSRKPRKT